MSLLNIPILIPAHISNRTEHDPIVAVTMAYGYEHDPIVAVTMAYGTLTLTLTDRSCDHGLWLRLTSY